MEPLGTDPVIFGIYTTREQSACKSDQSQGVECGVQWKSSLGLLLQERAEWTLGIEGVVESLLSCARRRKQR